MYRADEEIAEALANGEEVIPLNMEPTLVELLDIGVRRLKERPTWKVRSIRAPAAVSTPRANVRLRIAAWRLLYRAVPSVPDCVSAALHGGGQLCFPSLRSEACKAFTKRNVLSACNVEFMLPTHVGVANIVPG